MFNVEDVLGLLHQLSDDVFDLVSEEGPGIEEEDLVPHDHEDTVLAFETSSVKILEKEFEAENMAPLIIANTTVVSEEYRANVAGTFLFREKVYEQILMLIHFATQYTLRLIITCNNLSVFI